MSGVLLGPLALCIGRFVHAVRPNPVRPNYLSARRLTLPVARNCSFQPAHGLVRCLRGGVLSGVRRTGCRWAISVLGRPGAAWPAEPIGQRCFARQPESAEQRLRRPEGDLKPKSVRAAFSALYLAARTIRRVAMDLIVALLLLFVCGLFVCGQGRPGEMPPEAMPGAGRLLAAEGPIAAANRLRGAGWIRAQHMLDVLERWLIPLTSPRLCAVEKLCWGPPWGRRAGVWGLGRATGLSACCASTDAPGTRRLRKD